MMIRFLAVFLSVFEYARGLPHSSAACICTQDMGSPYMRYDTAAVQHHSSTVLSDHIWTRDRQIFSLENNRVVTLSKAIHSPWRIGHPLRLSGGGGESAARSVPRGFQAGDWRCGPCGIINYRRRTECFRCSARKGAGESAEGPQEEAEDHQLLAPPLNSSPTAPTSKLGFTPEDMERGRQIAFMEAARGMVSRSSRGEMSSP